MTRKIEVQRPYRHFKGKLYYVHNIVTHTETEEVLVSYQAYIHHMGCLSDLLICLWKKLKMEEKTI